LKQLSSRTSFQHSVAAFRTLWKSQFIFIQQSSFYLARYLSYKASYFYPDNILLKTWTI